MAAVNPVPLIAIVGETASGKSALALEIAKRFGGELICADSMTVYRGFDIGTAKPSTEERTAVPHHLLDVTTADRPFTVALFKQMAENAIHTITAQGHVPVLVGGSGLYIDSILFDYEFRTSAPPPERERLAGLTNAELLAELELKGISTHGVDTANNRRLIRLIETNGVVPARNDIRADTLVIGLDVPRDVLHENIAIRVSGMFSVGLEQEVRGLAEQYGWDNEAMRSIGYREFRAYFEGIQNLSQTKECIIRDTQQLAKKQRTWFRRNKYIHWVNDQEQAVEIVTTFLNNYRR